MRTVVFIILILIFILGVRFYWYFQNAPQLESGSKLSFESTLLSDPDLEYRFQRLTVRYEGRERIFVSTARFPVYSYGQALLIDGTVELMKLEGGGQIYTMSYPKIAVLESKNPIIRLSQIFRSRITIVFSEYLPYPSSSLLIGIVFGIKEGMPDDLTDKLSQTGIIHITAASGMNITLLAGAVFLIFGKVLHRKLAICISLVILWLYALIAGFDASIVRASIMASIAFSAALLGRQNSGWYALFLTAFVMLLINPSNLSDIGFQLSLASTAGILFLVPLMGKKKEGGNENELWFLSDDFKATTAAQIATVPILLSTFGSYGVFSIPINLLVLWTVPFLMILGGIAALVSFILPVLAAPFLYLSLPFLVYIEFVVDVASEMLPTFEIESFPISLSVGYYLILVSLVVFLYRRRDRGDQGAKRDPTLSLGLRGAGKRDRGEL